MLLPCRWVVRGPGMMAMTGGKTRGFAWDECSIHGSQAGRQDHPGRGECRVVLLGTRKGGSCTVAELVSARRWQSVPLPAQCDTGGGQARAETSSATVHERGAPPAWDARTSNGAETPRKTMRRTPGRTGHRRIPSQGDTLYVRKPASWRNPAFRTRNVSLPHRSPKEQRLDHC